MGDDDPLAPGTRTRVRRAASRRWRLEAHARRLDSLTLDAVVEQLAALDATALLALARHLRPRLAPSEDLPAPAVAERIVRMSAAELRTLGQRLRERLAAEAGRS